MARGRAEIYRWQKQCLNIFGNKNIKEAVFDYILPIYFVNCNFVNFIIKITYCGLED